MNNQASFETLSWRDPDGFVVRVDSRILRAVALEKADQMRALMRAPWIVDLIKQGLLPHTEELTSPTKFNESLGRWFWLEHEVLAFPCYPHEITAMQLYDSAQLTLKIAIDACNNGWMLKDASAWNVLFSGGRAVFVDWLSFEPEDRTGSWVAYGQFVRHFLLPLMVFRRRGITPNEIFAANRDGITPEQAYQLLGGVGLASASALEFVLMPKWLARRGARLIEEQSTRKKSSFGELVSRDLMMSTLKRLQRKLIALRPDSANVESVWKRYEEERAHYSEQDLAAKHSFIRVHLRNDETLLDLGCNAGEYSLLAAECSKAVIAADYDHPALTRLYMRIRGQETKITPLMLNVARPTPSIGWLNKEIPSFIERASGKFDCIMVLGLVHHLIVRERASLPMLADMLDRLNPKRLILEWVEPKDPKFRELAGLSGKLYSHLDATALEECLAQKFTLSAKLALPSGTRVMYLWSK